MSDHAGDSREQAIAAAIHALGVDKDLKASPSFTDWAAKKVLDAAHQAGHIHWADEFNINRDIIKQSMDRQRAIGEVAELRLALQAALNILTEALDGRNATTGVVDNETSEWLRDALQRHAKEWIGSNKDRFCGQDATDQPDPLCSDCHTPLRTHEVLCD